MNVRIVEFPSISIGQKAVFTVAKPAAYELYCFGLIQCLPLLFAQREPTSYPLYVQKIRYLQELTISNR